MVYVFLCEGYEEIEALAVVDILRRAGADVRIVGIGGDFITGAHGIVVKADIGEDAGLDGLEMIVLPGGPGASKLEAGDFVRKVIGYASAHGLWIGAICAAPSILGHMGLLAGRKAVCFPGYEKELEGAQICSDAVCEDGKLITANGPGAAVEFGLTLASRLMGDKRAYEVRTRMQIRG